MGFVCGVVGWRSYASGGGMGRPGRGGRRRMGADAARSEADGGGSGAARLTLEGASAQRGRAEGRMGACGLARLKRKPFGWSWTAERLGLSPAIFTPASHIKAIRTGRQLARDAGVLPARPCLKPSFDVATWVAHLGIYSPF
jgi:hypothetical protein